MSEAKIRIHVTDTELMVMIRALCAWSDYGKELAERITPQRIRVRQRNKEIRERFAAGQSLTTIARDFGLSEMTVSRALGRRGKMGRPASPEERSC